VHSLSEEFCGIPRMGLNDDSTSLWASEHGIRSSLSQDATLATLRTGGSSCGAAVSQTSPIPTPSNKTQGARRLQIYDLSVNKTQHSWQVESSRKTNREPSRLIPNDLAFYTHRLKSRRSAKLNYWTSLPVQLPLLVDTAPPTQTNTFTNNEVRAFSFNLRRIV
jgi:hypothetical protein